MNRLAVIWALLVSLSWGFWDFWPYLQHQDLLSRSIDICGERYPEMLTELRVYRDRLLAGVHDEDYDQDEVNGSYSDYSGYCAVLPAAWWPTARRRLNAIQWVYDPQNPNNWNAALVTYPSDPARAYYMLGHIIHNLQDLFVPAHAHIAPHGAGTGGLVENHSWPLYFDNFEQYCETGANELGRARAERIPQAPLETLMVWAARFAATDVESVGFRPSLYYARPDSAGGWGRYRPYPSGGYPCGRDRITNALADSWSLWLAPTCCEYGAAAIRNFWRASVGRKEGQMVRSETLFLPTSPIRPGSLLLEVAQPVRVQFFTPSGWLEAEATGTRIYCPLLPGGRWFVRVADRTGATVFPLTVIP